jgi:hypothetical protein
MVGTCVGGTISDVLKIQLIIKQLWIIKEFKINWKII